MSRAVDVRRAFGVFEADAHLCARRLREAGKWPSGKPGRGDDGSASVEIEEAALLLATVARYLLTRKTPEAASISEHYAEAALDSIRSGGAYEEKWNSDGVRLEVVIGPEITNRLRALFPA